MRQLWFFILNEGDGPQTKTCLGVQRRIKQRVCENKSVDQVFSQLFQQLNKT